MSTAIAKRPWKKAMEEAEAFKALFPPETYERWEFAGSLRRQRPEVGDIEVVIMPAFGEIVTEGGLFAQTNRVNLLHHHLDAMLARREIEKHAYGYDDTGAPRHKWGPKYRGMDWRGINYEMFSADKDNWGNILTIRTGPAEFSERLVTVMQRRGYRQDKGYLWTRTASGEDQMVPCPTEQHYFASCGVGYLAPEHRR